MRTTVLAPLLLGSLLTACGASGHATPEVDADTDRDDLTPDVCDDGDTRVCVGNKIYACEADGTTGELLETCPGSCSNGACTSDCGAEGVDLIYVVGTDYSLNRFDPTALPASGSADAAFEPVGLLNCPAGTALNGLGGPATPFSMSVDRNGTAWVLYSSGEIFHVSTEDASCTPTDFAVGQAGFELFGMGFASDAEGSDAETLYIAGGDASQIQSARLGSIDQGSMGVSTIATIGGASASNLNPELTGTGGGELWGYFPGQSQVARIGTTDGAVDQQIPMEVLPGQASAWAFAQHGGKFYVFVTYTDFFTFEEVPAVKVVDPVTHDIRDYATTNVIVGAGVSTCAPSDPIE